jgi:hypothetical protein
LVHFWGSIPKSYEDPSAEKRLSPFAVNKLQTARKTIAKGYACEMKMSQSMT